MPRPLFLDEPPTVVLREDIYKPLPQTSNQICWALVDPVAASNHVLANLSSALGSSNTNPPASLASLVDLFRPGNSHWRDTLALTAHLRTFNGARCIAAALSELARKRGVSGIEAAPDTAQIASNGSQTTWLSVTFKFTTSSPSATCQGSLMLVPANQTSNVPGSPIPAHQPTTSTPSRAPASFKIWAISTHLLDYIAYPEDPSLLRLPSTPLPRPRPRPIDPDLRDRPLQTDVLILGAGNAGLTAAARLKALGAPDFILLDKNNQAGDNWKHRYHSLRFHIGKNFCQMPYVPYREDANYELTRAELRDHARKFASELDLDSRTIHGARVLRTVRDDEAKTWTLEVRVRVGARTRDTYDSDDETEEEVRPEGGEEKEEEPLKITISCKAIILATGTGFGTPRVPDIPKRDSFAGPNLHSDRFRSGEALAASLGKRAVQGGGKSKVKAKGEATVAVVGSGNAALDVLQDCARAGLRVTVVQRSPTYIIPMPYYAHPHGMGAYDRMPTEEAYVQAFSVPLAVGGQFANQLHASLAAAEP